MDRKHHIGLVHGHVSERSLLEGSAAREPWPRADKLVAKQARACGQTCVDRSRGWRRVIQQEHELCGQTVTTREVENAPASHPAPHATRNFPRLKELLSREALCATNGARNAIEERLRWKSTHVARCEFRSTAVGEGHVGQM